MELAETRDGLFYWDCMCVFRVSFVREITESEGEGEGGSGGEGEDGGGGGGEADIDVLNTTCNNKIHVIHCLLTAY